MRSELIGIDVGGTKLAAARLTAAELSAERVVPTEKRSSAALIDQMVAVIEELRTPDVAAVGVGVPSVVSFATGTVRTSVNIPLHGVPLREVLRQRLALPVFVDNDATCAALAEAHDGDKLVVHDLVMFTVGTGVGGGIVIGGRVYRGATGAAGELGHTLLGVDLRDGAPAAPTPRFPQPWSLEAFASGTALDGLARAAAESQPTSALGRLLAQGYDVRGPAVVEAALAGDAVARSVLRRLGERLGVGIANAINTFDPEVVAVGGGVSRAGDLLLEPAVSTARRFVLPGVGERTEIRLARYGRQAGLLGAALMAGQELSRSTTSGH
jgi:glucokinase